MAWSQEYVQSLCWRLRALGAPKAHGILVSWFGLNPKKSVGLLFLWVLILSKHVSKHIKPMAGRCCYWQFCSQRGLTFRPRAGRTKLILHPLINNSTGWYFWRCTALEINIPWYHTLIGAGHNPICFRWAVRRGSPMHTEFQGSKFAIRPVGSFVYGKWAKGRQEPDGLVFGCWICEPRFISMHFNHSSNCWGPWRLQEHSIRNQHIDLSPKIYMYDLPVCASDQGQPWPPWCVAITRTDS